MNKNLNLIGRQQQAIDDILALGENGRRAMGYRLTFLNKKGRGLASIHRHYRAAAVKMGYSNRQIDQQWQDIKDMVLLEVEAQ